jgi:hypothetical protein
MKSSFTPNLGIFDRFPPQKPRIGRMTVCAIEPSRKRQAQHQLTLSIGSSIASATKGVAMQHFVDNAVNAFRDAIGLSVVARGYVPVARTKKLKTTKTTTKTV